MLIIIFTFVNMLIMFVIIMLKVFKFGDNSARSSTIFGPQRVQISIVFVPIVNVKVQNA